MSVRMAKSLALPRQVCSQRGNHYNSPADLGMNTIRIAELLHPFLVSPLSESQLNGISMYVDMLIRWNARTNLTSVRDPQEIVTRHFGESFFVARHLFPLVGGQTPSGAGAGQETSDVLETHVFDIGSGAGFPGLPIKIWAPQVQVTLIESNHKKVAFLREVIRMLTLEDTDVYAGRAENYPAQVGGNKLVTLRAVEHFDEVLPIALHLAGGSGCIALLIGAAQAGRVRQVAHNVRWEATSLPLSTQRVLLIGVVPKE